MSAGDLIGDDRGQRAVGVEAVDQDGGDFADDRGHMHGPVPGGGVQDAFDSLL